MKTNKPQIRWTESERAKLLDAMIAVFRREGQSVNNTKVLREAQLIALPSERRRNIVGATVDSVKPLLNRARVAAVQPAAEPCSSPLVERPADAMEMLLNSIADRIADRIAAQIADRVVSAMIGRHDSAATPPRPTTHNPEPEPEARPSRIGVLVVGLLGSQATEISRMFPQLDLTFLSSQEARRGDVIRRAHTVLMTQFIGHDVQDRYRRAPSLHLCNGGLSSLAATLNTIAA